MKNIRQGLGLRAKYILTISVFLIVFSATTTVITIRSQRESIRQRLLGKAQGMVSILAASMTDPLAALDMAHLRYFLANALEQEEVKYAYVFDARGRILADGTPENRHRDERLRDPISLKAVTADSMVIQFDRDVLDVSGPIFRSRSRIGGVRVGLSLTRMQGEIAAVYYRNLVFGGGFVLLGALGAFTLAHSVMRPIAGLIEGTRAVARGQLETQVRVSTRDELATLADHFNRMTEQLRRSQAALLFAKDYANNIIRSMLDMLIVVDPDGYILRVNAATCVLLGYEEVELVGQPFRKIMPQATPSEALVTDGRIDEGVLPRGEQNFRARDGRSVPVSLSAAAMHRADGNENREALVCVAHDLSRRKQAEEALAQQARELARSNAELQAKNAELDSFVYIVSHDLKAPLVTLQGMSGILLEDYGDKLDDEGRHFLERIQANTRQMEALIMDLLALSRIGREAKRPAVVHLSEVVQEFLLEMADRIRDRGIKVVCGDLGSAWAIRVQMEQVFGNLLSNAIKYSGNSPSPVVEIGGVDRGECMEYYVKDNGIGIDPAYQERVFEIFQRLGETEAEGTGIGLTIVRKVVEAAGGRVWVESAKGEGATFRFTWPKGPQGTGLVGTDHASPQSARTVAPCLPAESHAERWN